MLCWCCTYLPFCSKDDWAQGCKKKKGTTSLLVGRSAGEHQKLADPVPENIVFFCVLLLQQMLLDKNKIIDFDSV